MAEPATEPQPQPGTSPVTPQGGGDLQAKVAELQAQLATKDAQLAETEASNKGWQQAMTWTNQAGGREFIEALHKDFTNPTALKAAVEQAKTLTEWQPVLEQARTIGLPNAMEWLALYENTPRSGPTPTQPPPSTQPQAPGEKPLTRAELESLLADRERVQSLREQQDIVAETVAMDLRPGTDEADPMVVRIAQGQLGDAIKNLTGGSRDPTIEEIAIAGRKVKEMLEPLLGKAAVPAAPTPTPANPTPAALNQGRPGAGEPAKRPEEMTDEEAMAAVAALTAQMGEGFARRTKPTAGPGAYFT